MSLLLFFGMGLLIFILGLAMIFMTFRSGTFMKDEGGISGEELDFPPEPPPAHRPVV